MFLEPVRDEKGSKAFGYENNRFFILGMIGSSLAAAHGDISVRLDKSSENATFMVGLFAW